jgi:hypothetical protein
MLFLHPFQDDPFSANWRKWQLQSQGGIAFILIITLPALSGYDISYKEDDTLRILAT